MKRIAFTTLGCKSNRYDTEILMEACRRAGYEAAHDDGPADVHVVNTCTVTALADAQSRNMVRRARKRSPGARIIAVGCSSENDAETYRAMPEVDEVLGVRCVEELLSLLCHSEGGTTEESLALKKGTCKGSFASLRMTNKMKDSSGKSLASLQNTAPPNQSRARALLKIQDGCDRRCTYCAVWRARGPAQSVPVEDVLRGYRELRHAPEVMLTGIHIGRYGFGGVTLCDLMALLSAEEEGPRVRLGSLDPDECEERLAELMRHPRICRHVHLSVQSGSARILNAMGRAYNPDQVRRAVESVVERVPGVAVGADIIAGFPGETDEDHAATRRLVEEMPFSHLHVFPYSRRPRTKAADRPGQVPGNIKKARARELTELGRAKRRRYLAAQQGTQAEAVVISRAARDGCVRAVTDNYITLRGPAGAAYGGIVQASIDRVVGEEAYASWA